MSIEYRIGAATDIGPRKEVNQDSYFCAADNEASAALMAVADGVSGSLHGEIASGICTDELSYWWSSVLPQAGGDREKAVRTLIDAIQKANKLVLEQQVELRGLCATTLSVLFLLKDEWFIVHVGDSRIYRMGRGLFSAPELLTEDDEAVVSVEEDGRNVLRKRLLHYVGEADELTYHVKQGKVQNGDVFMGCSDGVVKTNDDRDLKKIIRSSHTNPGALCEKLIQTALSNGETDNITAAAVFCINR